jgi:hypothetical protein
MLELQLCLAASNSCAGRMDATVERQGLEALIGYGLEAFRASIIRRRGPMWRRERGEEREESGHSPRRRLKLAHSSLLVGLQPVRLAGGSWLVLVCSERRVLLAGCGWLLVAGSF